MLTKFDSNNWGVSEYTGIRNGNYSNVHEIPDGTNPKLVFYDGEQVIIKTQSEREDYDTAQTEITEIAFQAAKPLRLKQRENKYLGIIGELIAAGTPLTANDDSDAIEAKIQAASMTETEKLAFTTRLLAAMNDITQNGGNWEKLPTEQHFIEGE